MFLGSKVRPVRGADNLMSRLSRQCGILNISQPYGDSFCRFHTIDLTSCQALRFLLYVVRMHSSRKNASTFLFLALASN
jgi:hypothetical protein